MEMEIEFLGKTYRARKRRDYLIAGVLLVFFVGGFIILMRFTNQPLIALGETKSVTVGENIATPVNRVLFQGIISNSTDTILVFSEPHDDYTTYMRISLNTIRKIGSTFSVSGMTFNVISVEIPKNVTVIQRIS